MMNHGFKTVLYKVFDVHAHIFNYCLKRLYGLEHGYNKEGVSSGE